ncbi:MAG: hypothetical protein HY511_00345, partial [Actinobacteria bacterium]|nr:hypothetical protein [Actinomycetota bacterium]
MRVPVSLHRLPQIAADAAIVAAAWLLAFRLRFDPDVPRYYEAYLAWDVVALIVGLKLVVFTGFGFYNRWWRYVSTRDMWGAFRGVTVASVLAVLAFSLFEIHTLNVPRAVWILDWLICLALVAGVRLLARSVIERPSASSIVARGKEVIVVGAGDATQLILRELLRNPSLGYTPIGLIDDNPSKRNLRLHGIR